MIEQEIDAIRELERVIELRPRLNLKVKKDTIFVNAGEWKNRKLNRQVVTVELVKVG